MTRKTRRDLVHSPTSSQALRLRRDISGWALICTLAKFRLPGEGPESTGSVLFHNPADTALCSRACFSSLICSGSLY